MTRHSLGYLLSERAKKEHAQKFAAVISNAVQSSPVESTVVPNTVFLEIQNSPEEHNVLQETPTITPNVSVETTNTIPDPVPESETVIESATLDQVDKILHPEHKTTQ